MIVILLIEISPIIEKFRIELIKERLLIVRRKI
jgi:hypothetical protein